jgi:hypothetical protein
MLAMKHDTSKLDAAFIASLGTPAGLAKFKADTTAKAKADNPDATPEQIESSWLQLVQQFGL